MKSVIKVSSRDLVKVGIELYITNPKYGTILTVPRDVCDFREKSNYGLPFGYIDDKEDFHTASLRIGTDLFGCGFSVGNIIGRYDTIRLTEPNIVTMKIYEGTIPSLPRPVSTSHPNIIKRSLFRWENPTRLSNFL